VFLGLIAALNFLLFQPLLRVQAERESRTTGLVAQARKKQEHYTDLFDGYQTAIKSARMEGYRLQEQVRSDAMQRRAETLALARQKAEQLIQESRDSIQTQVEAARSELEHDAQEIALGIAATILQRSA